MPEEVEPDYKGALRIYWDIIKLPFTFLMALFGKKEKADIFAPIVDFWKYFWDAKVTAIIIIVNFVVFFALLFYLGPMPNAQRTVFEKQYLLDGPANLLSLNIIPFVANWFVHFTWAHILGNMVALFILGRVVEKNFGAGKFCLIYFGSGVISGVVDDLIHIGSMNYYANGASGAIAGLASAAMLIEPFYLVCLLLIPIPVFLFGWLQLYSDISGVLNPSAEGGVANFAHLGGFFAITILAFILGEEDRKKLLRGLAINIGTFLVLAAVWYFKFR